MPSRVIYGIEELRTLVGQETTAEDDTYYGGPDQLRVVRGAEGAGVDG